MPDWSQTVSGVIHSYAFPPFSCILSFPSYSGSSIAWMEGLLMAKFWGTFVPTNHNPPRQDFLKYDFAIKGFNRNSSHWNKPHALQANPARLGSARPNSCMSRCIFTDKRYFLLGLTLNLTFNQPACVRLIEMLSLSFKHFPNILVQCIHHHQQLRQDPIEVLFAPKLLKFRPILGQHFCQTKLVEHIANEALLGHQLIQSLTMVLAFQDSNNLSFHLSDDQSRSPPASQPTDLKQATSHAPAKAEHTSHMVGAPPPPKKKTIFSFNSSIHKLWRTTWVMHL